MSSKRLRTSSTCTNINAQSNSPIPEERKLKREVISPAYRPVLHPINIGNEVRAKPRAPVISPRTLNTPRRRSIIVNQYSPPTPSPRSSQITPPPAIKQQSLSPQMDISLSTNVRMPFPRPLQSIVDVSSWADSPLFQGPDSSDRNIPTPPIHQAQISAGNRRVQDMAIRSQRVSPNSVCSIRRSSSLPAGFPSPNQAITPTTSSTSTTEPSANTDVCHALAQELEETLELLAQKRLQLALLNALKNDDESDEDDEIISIVSPPRDKGDDKEGRGGHDVLLEMGFSPPEVKEALKACNEDMDEAIELLLTPRHTPEFTPPRAGYSLKRLSTTSLSPSPSTSLNDRTPGKIKPPPQPTECVVCMENDRNALILTCRHLCVCLDCGKKLKECPICTQSISSILEIYSS